MPETPGESTILYTQTGCADSARVRAWLRQRDIPFIERNVTDDSDAARELIASGIFATPLLVAGARTVLGYRPNELEVATMAEGASK